MKASKSLVHTSFRVATSRSASVACSAPAAARPSVSASTVPRMPTPSRLPPRAARSVSDVSRPSSTACSNAKKLAAKKIAGLQARSSARRSQRLFQASRRPVTAITPTAAQGESSRPVQPR